MKASELRSKTEKELRDELTALFREQFNLRMQRGVNPEGVRPNQFREVRRNIARVKTIMSANRKGEQS
jgi:large subunit ribosomal protein L29